MTPTQDRDNPDTGMVQRTIEGRTYQMLGKPGEEKETAKMLVKWVKERNDE